MHDMVVINTYRPLCLVLMLCYSCYVLLYSCYSCLVLMLCTHVMLYSCYVTHVLYSCYDHSCYSGMHDMVVINTYPPLCLILPCVLYSCTYSYLGLIFQ